MDDNVEKLRGNNIKVYKLVSGMTVVATELRETAKNFIINYPVIMVVRTSQASPESANVIFSPLPQYAKNFEKLMDMFPLKKSFIIFDDEMEESLIDSYQKYCVSLKARLSGIEIADSGALDKLDNLTRLRPDLNGKVK